MIEALVLTALLTPAFLDLPEPPPGAGRTPITGRTDASGDARASSVIGRQAVGPAAELFPLTSVRLLDGPFRTAVEANREYMLALDPDRLLAPFRREAGLEPRKPP